MKKKEFNQEKMYELLKLLFPIHRSITGAGLRKTLLHLKKIIPKLSIKSISSGTKVFDWTVPEEWVISEAYLMDKQGNRVIDIKNNNLHVISYSMPINKWIPVDELIKNIYTLPEKPDAIPYVTSYYKKNWGFCMSYNQLTLLKDPEYKAVIKSKFKSGFLNYGELLIPGKSKIEVFISTYICHPSLANNELSGPVVVTALSQWLQLQKNLNFSYRIIFIPETIGSIAYLSKNYKSLKNKVIAGFNVTCVGDENCYSYLPSRSELTYADKVAKHALRYIDVNFKKYSWLDRGGDERQYCAPGIDLPVVSIMRSKYGEYSQYHTSLDNLDFVSQKGLEGSLDTLKKCIEIIENDCYLITKVLCEPKLDKIKIYPTTSFRDLPDEAKTVRDILTYADGSNSLLDIAIKINKPFWNLIDLVNLLEKNKLIKKIPLSIS